MLLLECARSVGSPDYPCIIVLLTRGFSWVFKVMFARQLMGLTCLETCY
jgi:hypothetical protein